MLTSAAKAEIAKITGAVTPTPANACFPAPGIRPMNILSTKLYKILINCAAIAGIASLKKAFGTGSSSSNSFSSFIVVSPYSYRNFLYYHRQIIFTSQVTIKFISCVFS